MRENESGRGECVEEGKTEMFNNNNNYYIERQIDRQVDRFKIFLFMQIL